jgi:hypothetical protein
MKPIKFKQQNVVFAENQPEYFPLPAHRTPSGKVTSCWSLSWKERLRILFTGKIFWTQLTFNQPLQPVRPSLEFNEGTDDEYGDLINDGRND